MPHPNEDFIKKFLGKNIISPAEQKAMLKKQRLNEYYNALEQSKQPKTLDESVKKDLVKTTEKIFYRKPKYITEETQGTWVSQLTPYGVFHYNKTQNLWMNNYGVIKPSIEELIALVATDYLTVSESSESSKDTVVQSFFSDDGNTLAVFNSASKTVKTYSITYTPSVSTTLLKTVNVGSTPFTAATNEKCFISNDGNYLVLSSPSNKSVYFFDVNQNTLLQTITENYSNFGSKIALDKDFYGMAISTYDLTRDPSYTDTRVTSYGVSSPIMYYKRNFGSSSNQQFKKIHTQNAITNYRHSGLATWVGVSQIISLSDYFNDPPSGSLNNTCGINRCDDISCKGYNFAISNIALEIDQINYKAHFPNLSNSKFNIIQENGFTFTPNYTNNMVYKMLGATGNVRYLIGGITTPIKVYTDEYLSNTQLSDYFMEGTPGLKNFSIVRKINEEYIYDNSYKDSGTLPLSFAPELSSTNISGNVNPAYDNTFMGKMYVKFAQAFSDNALSRPARQGLDKGQWDAYERHFLNKEEILNSKVCVNSTDTYSINKFITNSIPSVGATASTQNLNIKNIRIYRFPSTNTVGTDAYMYNDWNYTGTEYVQTPNALSIGWIKVMYNSSDQTNLELALLRNQPWAITNPPVLADPTNCPNSQFAYTVSSTILSQEIQNCYASDDRLFVNLTNSTMVFKIDKSVEYKPLLFEATISSLSSYSFNYNSQGEFFGKTNMVYKYNRTTHILDLITTIG